MTAQPQHNGPSSAPRLATLTVVEVCRAIVHAGPCRQPATPVDPPLPPARPRPEPGELAAGIRAAHLQHVAAVLARGDGGGEAA